jgi:hypothetical protein
MHIRSAKKGGSDRHFDISLSGFPLGDIGERSEAGQKVSVDLQKPVSHDDLTFFPRLPQIPHLFFHRP